MRIAACLPLKFDSEKSRLFDALLDMRRVADEVIVLHDYKSPWYQKLDVSEEIRIESQKEPNWNDFTNRLTLLARATRLGCDCVMWQDDDELLGPTLTRDRILSLCCQMLTVDGNASPVPEYAYAQVVVKTRTLWNRDQWRCDGQFGRMIKTFLQVNPLMLRRPEFEWGPEKELHHFPNGVGTRLEVQDYIVHYGMLTRSLREKNAAKYERADPDCKFSCVPYNWLLDETGIELKPINQA